MRKIIKATLILLLVWAIQGFTQRNTFKNGVGVIFGNPDIGISIKFLNSGFRYFNGAVAWSSGDDKDNKSDGYVHLHADYVFKQWRIFNRRATNFTTYIGAGLQLVTVKKTYFGVRIPVGLNYTFSEVPLDTFFELVPLIGLTPDTDFDIDAAFAIRFLF